MTSENQRLLDELSGTRNGTHPALDEEKLKP
jgi:hypothetical protein